jgi:hypothetical protein
MSPNVAKRKLANVKRDLRRRLEEEPPAEEEGKANERRHWRRRKVSEGVCPGLRSKLKRCNGC